MTAHEDTPPSRPGLFRRHKVVTAVVTLLLLVVGATAAFRLYVESQLGNLSYFESQLDEKRRPAQPTDEAAEAQDILVLGTDKGPGRSIEEELADGRWTPGAFRSDTIMLAHIPADRSQAYLVSIPRDSYVRIPGHGRQKINAAFSLGGPDLTTRTVEGLTGVFVDHVAMIGWDGFKDLTRAIGGVRVTVPKTFTDPHNDRTWRAGTYNLQGQRALDYVRTRYGLEQGDFDRIERQQNFLRAVMRKTLRSGTLTDPLELDQLLQAVTAATTVDSGWSEDEMRDLALDLQALGSKDVHYLTVPTDGIRDVPGVGSVVVLDREENRALWRAVRTDRVHSYLNRYGGDTLPRADRVH